MKILAYTPTQLAKAVTMSMDGVVWTLTERENYCKIVETPIYRKASEMRKPELCGGGKELASTKVSIARTADFLASSASPSPKRDGSNIPLRCYDSFDSSYS